MADQIPFGTSEFSDNPEPRCACLLLLDTSGSMSISAGGAQTPIDAANEGILAFKTALLSDPLASKRVEVSLVTFGPTVKPVSGFQDATNFQPPTLTASGGTPMGQAVIDGLGLLKVRKDAYKTGKVATYRPWVFLITDGAPTDEPSVWARAVDLVKQGEAEKSFAFYAVGVPGADIQKLRSLSVRDPVTLVDNKWREMFLWLSGSLRTVSKSTPDDEPALENPAAPNGWAKAPSSK